MDEFLIKTKYKKDKCKELLIKNFKGRIFQRCFTGHIFKNKIYLSYGGFRGYINIFYYVYGVYNEKNDEVYIKARLNLYTQISNILFKFLAILIALSGLYRFVKENFYHFNYLILIEFFELEILSALLYGIVYMSESICNKIINNLVKVLDGEIINYPRFYKKHDV